MGISLNQAVMMVKRLSPKHAYTTVTGIASNKTTGKQLNVYIISDSAVKNLSLREGKKPEIAWGR